MMLCQMQVKKPCGMAECLRMTKGKASGTMLKYAHQVWRKTNIHRKAKLKTEFKAYKIISNKCYPTIPLSLSKKSYGHVTCFTYFFFFFFSIYSTSFPKALSPLFLTVFCIKYTMTKLVPFLTHTNTQQPPLWNACCIYQIVSSALETVIYTISVCTTQYCKLNSMLRKTNAVAEEWRSMQYEELQTLYCSPILLGWSTQGGWHGWRMRPVWGRVMKRWKTKGCGEKTWRKWTTWKI
jgi:hypothetical protein